MAWADALSSTVVVSLGSLLGVALAGKAFEEPYKASQGNTISPRFLTRRTPFIVGKLFFIVSCLAIYFVGVHDRDGVSKLLTAVDILHLNGIRGLLDDPDRLVSMTALTIIFLTFVGKNFKFNFIYWERDFIYGCISIPDIYRKIHDQLLGRMIVPVHDRSMLEGPQYEISGPDFTATEGSFRRRWADLVYLDQWITTQEKDTPAEHWVDDEDFDFEKLSQDFDRYTISAKVRLTNPQSLSDKMIADLDDSLDALKEKYAHYLTCMLLATSSSRANLYAQCRLRNIDIGPLTVGNPIIYSLIYAITLAVALPLAPLIGSACSAGYDFLTSTNLHDAFSIGNMHIRQNWLERGIGNYLCPIMAVLFFRNIAWQLNPIRRLSSISIYSVVLVFAFVVSALGSAAVALALAASSDSAASQAGTNSAFQLAELYFGDSSADLTAISRALPWSIGPAMISVYINYYLDRQADPSKPDIARSRSTILGRIVSAIVFTALLLALTLPGIFDLQAIRDGWTVERSQIVVAISVSIINLSLCLVAQFALPSLEQIKAFAPSASFPSPAPADVKEARAATKPSDAPSGQGTLVGTDTTQTKRLNRVEQSETSNTETG